MQDALEEQAIQAALEGNWESAVELNLSILHNDQQNITALNRLGKAYSQLNKLNDAKTVYENVLKIDPYNHIALKNLKSLEAKKVQNKNQVSPSLSSNFLEESGKTKTTQLVRLADKSTISSLQIGQKLILQAKKRNVCIKNDADLYIGSLPDDLALRIGKLIRLGNKYEILVKNLEKNTVQIFIREIYKSKKSKNTPSFPSSQSVNYNADLRYSPFPEEPLDIRETGEDDGS